MSRDMLWRSQCPGRKASDCKPCGWCCAGASGFVRDGRNRNAVDESATAPKEQSLFVKDRAAVRKVRARILVSLECAALQGGGWVPAFTKSLVKDRAIARKILAGIVLAGISLLACGVGLGVGGGGDYLRRTPEPPAQSTGGKWGHVLPWYGRCVHLVWALYTGI